jgi:hypothetical protein
MAILGTVPCINSCEGFFKGTNLLSTLEVSHSMSSLIPISAKQKGGLLINDIPFILRSMELRN